jgi:hypothetical protein
MHHSVIKEYYAELKKDSLEHAVDVLWANILPLYFTVTQGYGVEQQARPWPGVTKTKADFAIRYVKNGQPKKVCLIEDKRVKYESSDSKWADAAEQLTGYMTTTRAANPNPNESMYGIVTVGHYSRFYVLKPGERQLSDYSGHDGTPLHFKHHEQEIDAVLCDLVALTQSNSGSDMSNTQANSSSSVQPGGQIPAPPPAWVWDEEYEKYRYWDGTEWVWQS